MCLLTYSCKLIFATLIFVLFWRCLGEAWDRFEAHQVFDSREESQREIKRPITWVLHGLPHHAEKGATQSY